MSRPGFTVLGSDILTDEDAQKVRAAIERWFARRLSQSLEPLLTLANAGFAGAARGIAFQLVEGLGVSTERTCLDLVRGLDTADRRRLTTFGVRFRHPCGLRQAHDVITGSFLALHPVGACPRPRHGAGRSVEG